MKRLAHKNVLLKILMVITILLLLNSKVSAIGIKVLYYSSIVNDSTITVLVEIDSTLPYRIYENNSEIANGTLFAYTLTNVTTTRNLTVNTVILHSLFINGSTEDYWHHIWINFSYSNYPNIPEFEVKSILLLTVVFCLFTLFCGFARKQEKTKDSELPYSPLPDNYFCNSCKRFFYMPSFQWCFSGDLSFCPYCSSTKFEHISKGKKIQTM